MLNPEQNRYRRRLIEDRLDALMSAFGCVEIVGPKWCGKTWTALTRCNSATTLDDMTQRMTVELDPSLATVGEAPHLIDEWQEVPSVWDAARHFVDSSGNKKGLLIMTGSSSLRKDRRGEVHHSGAGRIARLDMRPMALCESGECEPHISLMGLLRGEEISPCNCETSLFDIARWCCRGGWPANLDYDDQVALETAVQYVRSVCDVNIFEEGRSPELAYSLLHALSLNISQAATLKTLGKDMSFGEKPPDEGTIRSYLEIFDQLKVIESLSGWEPQLRSKIRVRKKPKRYFCDPSLPAAMLGTNPSELLKDTQTLGLLFECLVFRELKVFLSTYSGVVNDLCYYRDERGLEADFIIRSGSSWGAIEVKLSDTKTNEAADNLLAFKDRINDAYIPNASQPKFLAVVVGRGSMAYKRPDGILVIPIALLGP